MAYKHKITSRDKWFLDKHMKDPVAQELFKVGDAIVICAKCKTAHYDSTWEMNTNKCCSMGCNHNVQLNYTAFSPIIFLPKATHRSGFSIVTERLPFLERLKLFNGYPLANAVTILIPIIVIALMVYFAQTQAIQTFSFADQLTITQSKIDYLGETSKSKLERIIEDPQKLNISFGDMDNKVVAVTSSFGGIPIKISQADVGDKVSETVFNLASRTEYASGKISLFFEIVSEFFSNLLGGIERWVHIGGLDTSI